MKIPKFMFPEMLGYVCIEKKNYAVMFCLKSKRMYQPNFSKGAVA